MIMGALVSVLWDTMRRRICDNGVGVGRDSGLEELVTTPQAGSSTRRNCGGSAFDLRLLHAPQGVENLGLQWFAGRKGCLPEGLVSMERAGQNSRESRVLALASLGLEGDCKTSFPAAKCAIRGQSLVMSVLKRMSLVNDKEANVIDLTNHICYFYIITSRLNDSLDCYSFGCDLAHTTRSGPVKIGVPGLSEQEVSRVTDAVVNLLNEF